MLFYVNILVLALVVLGAFALSSSGSRPKRVIAPEETSTASTNVPSSGDVQHT